MDYRTIYATRADDYDRMIAREDAGQVLLNTIRSLAGVRGKDIVDVGAGTGRLAVGLGALGAKSVHALDAERAMLDVLERRALAAGVTRLATTVADNESLPLADACCDLATAGWTYGHLTRFHPDDWPARVARAASELRRIVRPGGTVIVIETLGLPGKPVRPALQEFQEWLERDQGMKRIELDTDFVFRSVREADERTRFFFGDAIADDLVREKRTRLPERTGLWWRRA
jgi:ubiquinone/menaquinone biosynthesis C-methylase UbiE